jgi:hypothetical protein
MLTYFYKAAWYGWGTAIVLHVCALLGSVAPKAVTPIMFSMSGFTLLIAFAGMINMQQYNRALMEGAEAGDDGFPIWNMFKGVPAWTARLALMSFAYPALIILLPFAHPEGEVFDHGTYYTLIVAPADPVVISVEVYSMHVAKQLSVFSAAWFAFLSLAIWMLYPKRVMPRDL